MDTFESLIPPADLTPEAAALWGRIRRQLNPDAATGALLDEFARAFDRAKAARTILAKEGLLSKDRYGRPRSHPAAVIEGAAIATMARLARLLGVEPVGPVGRPPASAQLIASLPGERSPLDEALIQPLGGSGPQLKRH